MEAAPNIISKLWDNVSIEDAWVIFKENNAWDSCVDGMMAIHKTVSFEDALVLVIHYENPKYDKSKNYDEEMINCVPDMREFIRKDIKKTCVLHGSLNFEELFILAKYRYLKAK